jgi:hypothetical protein
VLVVVVVVDVVVPISKRHTPPRGSSTTFLAGVAHVPPYDAEHLPTNILNTGKNTSETLARACLLRPYRTCLKEALWEDSSISIPTCEHENEKQKDAHQPKQNHGTLTPIVCCFFVLYIYIYICTITHTPLCKYVCVCIGRHGDSSGQKGRAPEAGPDASFVSREFVRFTLQANGIQTKDTDRTTQCHVRRIGAWLLALTREQTTRVIVLGVILLQRLLLI